MTINLNQNSNNEIQKTPESLSIEEQPMCFRCMGFNTRWIFQPNSWKCKDCGYCTDGFDHFEENYE
ncbi:MAG: hypothetical protein QNJ60_21335 [Xenococcaceae cyanobacterium MO_188.B19]|nr:hypothetical protein [Xenococcaceae cyanobacterium MO_188.B19]